MTSIRGFDTYTLFFTFYLSIYLSKPVHTYPNVSHVIRIIENTRPRARAHTHTHTHIYIYIYIYKYIGSLTLIVLFRKKTLEFLAEIQAMIDNDPRKSIRSIVRDMRVSKFLIRQVVHDGIRHFSYKTRKNLFCPRQGRV